MQNDAAAVMPSIRLGSWVKPSIISANRYRNDRPGRPSLNACRRGAAALEFALVSAPFLLMLFGFVATNAMFYCWSVMQNNAQYAAMMMATGQVSSWSSSGVTCSSSLTNTQVEYYACSGLPPWTTYTAKATLVGSNVAVTLTTNASTAGLADIYALFSGVTLTASATAMKQGSSCS